MKKKILAAAGLIFQLSALVAQPNADSITTLDALWRKAENQNKQIQLKQLELQEARIRTEAIREERLPELKASGEYARVSNLPIYTNGLFSSPDMFPVIHNFYSVGAEAGFDLYTGGKFNRSIEKSELQEQMQTQQVNLTRAEIRYRIALYYLDIYRNEQYRDFIKQDIKERENQLQDITNLYNKGVVLKSDVLRAELNLNSQREKLEETTNSILIDTKTINLLTGDSVTVIHPDPESLNFSATNLTDVKSSFHYQFLEQQTAFRKLELKDVKQQVLPTVQLFANYAYSYPQIRFYPYEIALYGLGMAGIRATIPISNLYTDRKKKVLASMEISKNELEKQDFTEQFVLETTALQIRYQEALNKLEIARQNIQTAEENFRIMQNAYFAQLALLTDMLDAETQLLQAKMDYTTQEVNARLINYQLLKITGKI